MTKQDQDKNVKDCMGMPMRWDHKKIFKNLWNSEDDRILPPKYFGIGWDLNLHALLKKTGLIKGRKGKGEKK